MLRCEQIHVPMTGIKQLKEWSFKGPLGRLGLITVKIGVFPIGRVIFIEICQYTLVKCCGRNSHQKFWQLDRNVMSKVDVTPLLSVFAVTGLEFC